uniref:ARID domain-containing protein n=1 Tax=Fagus sylvatica TaxID=28930 RepID=A0A2N9FZ07_FAGSY
MDSDNNSTHPHTPVNKVEEQVNPSHVENNIDDDNKGLEFPIENQVPVDVSTTTLKDSDDANEPVLANTQTDVTDVNPSNRLKPDSPHERSMEILELKVDREGKDTETDASDSNPSNQQGPDVPLEGSMETEAKNEDKGHELNVGMSKMELSPDREIKEQVLKPKLDVGNEVCMKTPEQSFLLAPDGVEGDESGTEEDQTAFMMDVENFYKERSLEFKPPKFYQKELNLLKLWRAVIKLGGYEQVTSCKLWRQVGQSFNPPKTCTTVSWTFRIFYEKALLEYEKHKMGAGELAEPTRVNNQGIKKEINPMFGIEGDGGKGEGKQGLVVLEIGEHCKLPADKLMEVSDSQALGSGRALRDAAARAMQGWHSRRLFGNGEIGDPIIKEKNLSSMPKGDKQLKSVGLLKRKKPSTVERNVQVANFKVTKPQLDTMVVDVGPPADWVKINVQRFNDCFEVYALVPGLLREEDGAILGGAMGKKQRVAGGAETGFGF